MPSDKLRLFREDIGRLLVGEPIEGTWAEPGELSLGLCWQEATPAQTAPEMVAAVAMLPDLRPYFRGSLPESAGGRLTLARETLKQLGTLVDEEGPHAGRHTKISPPAICAHDEGKHAAAIERIITTLEPVKTLWRAEEG
jgi:hypothetical protein